MDKNFELFAGCLGNGTTYCNKAVEEHGDYKKIAHVSEQGNIRWYTSIESVPADALLRIEHDADAQRANFLNKLNAMPIIKQYGYMLDNAPIGVMLEITSSDMTLNEKVAMLKTKLYNVLPTIE